MARLRPTTLTALTAALAVLVAACSSAPAASPAPSPAAPASTPTDLVSATPTPSATPDPTPTPTATPVATQTPQPGVSWIYNVYDARAVRWQDPDKTACTAASAQMMLNMATYWHDYTSLDGGPTPSAPHGWKPDVSYTTMETVLAYQRQTGTMLLSWPGADAHGWRNSLNFYGWGGIGADVWRDMSFTSFDEAARATVRAIALYRKPVGILGWAGDHAQIVTGYRVSDEDPRTGATEFKILGVYLTDPLKADGYRDYYVPLATWKSGAKTIRFTPYKMTNSPYKDPIDGHVANDEWYGKWVIVAPVA
jgi:hypothetical protein